MCFLRAVIFLTEPDWTLSVARGGPRGAGRFRRLSRSRKMRGVVASIEPQVPK